MDATIAIGRGILGMVVLLSIGYVFSSDRKAINWKTVGYGLLCQLLLAIGILKGAAIGFNIGGYRFDLSFIGSIFNWGGKAFTSLLDFTLDGTKFLMGENLMDADNFGFVFAFQVLPTIIFFSALTSVLFYLGIIQKVVALMAKVMTKILKVSGAESLSVAGNIFLGQTEAPLMIKPYLEKMTRSEILLVMVGGMATVAGGVLAAYIGFLGGDDPVKRLEFARHLLAASVMAAPGAIVISKMLYPETEEVDSTVFISNDKIGSNVLDAIATGTTEGVKLAANVGAMLLVFVAFIAMLNGMLGWVGGIDSVFGMGEFTSLNELIQGGTPYQKLSLEFMLGYLFAPLMWLIGVAGEDTALMGQLLGIKLAASEFVGYIQLSELKNPENVMHLANEKSIIMATYMLCGFGNFASVGIQIGGIGFLAPSQRTTLSELGLKALLGGTIASLMSATLIGILYSL